MWNLLFDLGGVIFKIDWTITNQKLGISADIRWWEWPEYDAYERGHLNGREFQTRLEARLDRQWGDDHFRRAIQDMIISPLPGIEDLLAGIDVPTFALSNTNEAHREAFIDSPVLRKFNRIVTSFEIGLRKPEHEAFQKSLTLLGIDASRTLYFDDRPENVSAASECGLRAYQTVDSVETTAQVLKEFGLIR